MLMEDYNISPELVNACNEDIENNCKVLGKKGNNPGEVIHCLMRAVMEQKVTDQKVKNINFTKKFREIDLKKNSITDRVSPRLFFCSAQRLFKHFC